MNITLFALIYQSVTNLTAYVIFWQTLTPTRHSLQPGTVQHLVKHRKASPESHIGGTISMQPFCTFVVCTLTFFVITTASSVQVDTLTESMRAGWCGRKLEEPIHKTGAFMQTPRNGVPINNVLREGRVRQPGTNDGVRIEVIVLVICFFALTTQ